MKVWNTVVLASLVGACVGLAHPAVAHPATARPGVARATDAEDALEARITDRLKNNSILAPRDIDVEVKGRIVTLTGSVRTSSEKAQAGQLARVSGVSRVHNEIDIDPKLDDSKLDNAADKTKAGLNKAVDATVGAARKTKELVQKGVGKSEEGVAKVADKTSDAIGKAGDATTDTSISTRVKADMSGDSLLTNTAIEVETSDRVVTLKGTVPSATAKARAAEIAGRPDGVMRVVDELVVIAP
ncbi:MAG: BON domain-containing protein [Acidobacteriota bacterium]